MLISFSGLPGVGKSAWRDFLAQRIKAVWLRIDSLEQALVRSGVVDRDGLGPAGYYVAMPWRWITAAGPYRTGGLRQSRLP